MTSTYVRVDTWNDIVCPWCYVGEERLRRYGRSPEQSREMDGRVAALAAAEGLPYTSDRVTVNTFDAHRLIAAADEVGARLELLHALQRGHFSGKIDLSDADALVAAAVRVGLSEGRAREVMASEQYADAVRADRAAAQSIGVTGVPFTVIDQRLAIPGCVDAATYEMGLRRGLETVRQPA